MKAVQKKPNKTPLIDLLRKRVQGAYFLIGDEPKVQHERLTAQRIGSRIVDMNSLLKLGCGKLKNSHSRLVLSKSLCKRVCGAAVGKGGGPKDRQVEATKQGTDS